MWVGLSEREIARRRKSASGGSCVFRHRENGLTLQNGSEAGSASRGPQVGVCRAQAPEHRSFRQRQIVWLFEA